MRQIQLSQGKFAQVDDEDFERVNKFKWCIYKSKNGNVFYAARKVIIDGKRKTQRMHQFILGDNPLKPHIDHRDGDGLNNQKYNLRPCSNMENTTNKKKTNKKCSSIYKGVCWDNHSNKWRAYIQTNGKLIYLGLFKIEIDAARAYDIAAIKYHGEFRNLNFNN